MADDVLDKIKKLPPEERVRKLRDIEAKMKKEIAEADKLMKQSISEIETKERLRTLEMPEAEQVDISKLFTPEETGELEKKEETVEESVESFYRAKTAGAEEPVEWYSEQTRETLQMKIEDRIKYVSEADKIDEELTASKSVDKKIKKYTLG